MEETNKDEKVGCCGTKKCCGGKALAALLLVGVGAVGGYFGGRCCATKEFAAKAAASAPANPAK